jgi:hypothetical protein
MRYIAFVIERLGRNQNRVSGALRMKRQQLSRMKTAPLPKPVQTFFRLVDLLPEEHRDEAIRLAWEEARRLRKQPDAKGAARKKRAA